MNTTRRTLHVGSPETSLRHTNAISLLLLLLYFIFGSTRLFRVAHTWPRNNTRAGHQMEALPRNAALDDNNRGAASLPVKGQSPTDDKLSPPRRLSALGFLRLFVLFCTHTTLPFLLSDIRLLFFHTEEDEEEEESTPPPPPPLCIH